MRCYLIASPALENLVLQPQCLRCGAIAQAPICSRCLGFLAKHRPLLFDPRLEQGPSVADVLAKGKRLMLTVGTEKAFALFDDPPLDWKSETQAESILKHMGFNGGSPSVLTTGDAEILHDILSRAARNPPTTASLESRLQALKMRVDSAPYLPHVQRQVEPATQVAEPAQEPPVLEEPEPPAKENVEEIPEQPLPGPDDPDSIPPSPPDAPEPHILPPPPPPFQLSERGPEPEPPQKAVPPPPEIINAMEELEQMRAEIERLSIIKAQMERQREEMHSMLQVERSALEEREVLVTAQAATLQSRARELKEKEKDLNSKQGEMSRQRRRLDLMETLVTVPGLEKKDFQVLRAKYQDLESLKSASLDDLQVVGQLGESKSREVYSALHPNWSNEEEDLASRAQALLEVGDHHGALECYEFMLRKSPDSENLWFNKAEVLGMIGDREGALQAYTHVLEINRKNVVAWREKADLLFEASRIEEGIRALRNLIEIDRGQVEVLLAKADELVTHKKERDAVLLYNAILEADPGNVRAHLGLGDSLVVLGDCDMADKMFTRALGRDPQNPKALYKKGTMLDRRGRWGAALQLFNRAIALDWNYSSPWVGKGDILLKQGKPSEALDCFHKAIEFEPDRADAWAGKAKAHHAKGEIEEAEAAKAKAADLSPGDETLRELQKVLAQSKRDATNEPRKVLIREDSAEILKSVLKASKTISESQILRRLADIALDSGDYEEALRGYSEALDFDEGDVDAWCGKGLTLRKLGKLEEAWEAYDHALKIDPEREDAKHGREACSKKEVGN